MVYRRTWIAGVLAALATMAARASAAVKGRYRPTRKAVDEDAGSWRVLVSISLHAPPSTAVIALKFVFVQRVDFERDDSKGVRRRVVSQPRTITQSKQVDFSDIRGGIGRNGRADLVLVRRDKCRAGEWTFEIKGPDGSVGPPASVVLKGTNPPEHGKG